MAATHGPSSPASPASAIATLGPGALNFTTGAAYALLGAMPMVMITGQKGILSHKQAGFPDGRHRFLHDDAARPR